MSRSDYSIVTPPYTAESINSASLLTESVTVLTSEINRIQSQPRKSRVTSNTEIIYSDNNSNLRQLKLIFSRYLSTERQSNKLATIIDSLRNDGSITLNELILKLPYNNRPTQEQRTLILHELQEIGLIEMSSAAKNSIMIRKGPLYY
jgi:hypothetical protein